MDELTLLTIAIWIVFALGFLFAIIMTIIEEKNRCKHIWKTIDTQTWVNRLTGSQFIKFIQECKKCGEVRVIRDDN